MTPHFFVGVDIEAIARFRKLVGSGSEGFLKKVFSARELEHSFSRKSAPQHLAARFAGKEAVVKALMSSGRSPVPHRQIEILNDTHGAPYVHLDDDVLRGTDYTIRISLSHDSGKAVAFVIMFVEPQDEGAD